jgi:hypothetical protein
MTRSAVQNNHGVFAVIIVDRYWNIDLKLID